MASAAPPGALGRRGVVAWALAALVAAILVWDLIVRFEVLSPRVVAPPWDVAKGLVELAGMPDVRVAFLQVMWFVAIAFVIGSAIGITLGIILGLSRYAYQVFYPFLLIWFSIPKLIFIPVMVILFGVGDQLKIAYGTLAAIPTLTVTYAAGVRMVDERLLRTARSFGASRLLTVRKVVLPGAVPSMMTGLWYALQSVLLGVVVTELFVSSAGIGRFVKLYSATFRPDYVYGLLIAVAVASILLASGLSVVEKRATAWLDIGREARR